MKDLVVVVIGGSRGIGLGLVAFYLRSYQSARVFATYRSSSSSLASLNALSLKYKDRLRLVELDVSSEGAFERAAQIIGSQQRCVDRLIYSAGVLHTDKFGPEKQVKSLNSAQLTEYFQTNSIGFALCSRYFQELLKESLSPALVAISAKVGSISDNRSGGWYGYRASKAALNMLVKTVALEYQRVLPRCSVVAVHPGTTDTDLSKPFQNSLPAGQLQSVEQCVLNLTSVIEGLTTDQTGSFINWDGSILTW
jgi:NAD(P)-dependent dehydrogenase (short-subunit alcohol dehydrogenase family)